MMNVSPNECWDGNVFCVPIHKNISRTERRRKREKNKQNQNTHKSAELIASLRFFTVKYFVLEFFFLFHFFFNFIFSFVFVSPMQWIVAILSVMNTFDGWHDYVAKISVWQFAFTGESLLSGSLFLIFIKSIKSFEFFLNVCDVILLKSFAHAFIYSVIYLI